MEDARSPEWIPSKSAAELLGCSVQHLRLLVRQGKVDAWKPSRDWLISESSLQGLIMKRDSVQDTVTDDRVDEQGALFDDHELRPITNVSSVPQRSPFRYPGGKTWLIPIARQWLSSLSSKPQVLLEPFAGGGGISLMAAFEGYVDLAILVELDPEIAIVWEVMLGNQYRQLADLILNFSCVPTEVNKVLIASPKSRVQRAFKTIVRNRVTRGGILAAGAGLVKTGEANRGIASRWYPHTLARRIEDIHSQRGKLKFVHGDGLKELANIEIGSNSAFFIDPPYPVAGRRLYTHHELEHASLFEILSRTSQPFLATYDDNPEIIKLAAEHRFEMKLVPMKSTHHAKKYELIISRDLSWLTGHDTVAPVVLSSPRKLAA